MNETKVQSQKSNSKSKVKSQNEIRVLENGESNLKDGRLLIYGVCDRKGEN
jgi:hypothetical protein